MVFLKFRETRKTMTQITTRAGTLTGIEKSGTKTFYGIPYAAPPVGSLRWQPPQKISAWSGERDATAPGNRSIQIPYMEALAGMGAPGEESEDCLYLNIFAPDADNRPRPVMVWIHGGAYIQGSANEYDGGILAAENDVVIVAINYRLGIFGYMDLSPLGAEYEGSASLGFQDQIAALEWVRDNIADYGGDPENVTIFGESAGGGSVLALMGAPKAKGLFHKAIAFSPGDIIDGPQDNVAALSSNLDLEGEALLKHLWVLVLKGSLISSCREL